MKKTLSKPKTFLITGAVSLAIIAGMTFTNHKVGKSQALMYKANSGLGICFQRVSQTFTALMINDFSSGYLSKDFRSISSECFNEVSRMLNSLALEASVLKDMNNLNSDLHWFDQKVDKVSEMAQKDEIDISQSNITNKYYELESLKSQLEEGLAAKIEDSGSTTQWGALGVLLSQLALLFSALAFFMQRKVEKIELQRIENSISEMISESRVDHTVFEYGKKAFERLGTPKLQEAYETFFANILREKNDLEDSLLNMNSIENERYDITRMESEDLEEKDTADFNDSFNTVLDRVQEKIFNKGIILDTDLNDNFKVYAKNEDLEQFLYSLLSFSIDCADKRDDLKKVSIRSKSLGGIAYCKVKIADYVLQDSDIAVLNGAGPEKDTPVNLLLLKELMQVMDTSLAIKNRQNSSTGVLETELEVIFERAKEDNSVVETRRPTNIVKGNKKQIKEFLESRL